MIYVIGGIVLAGLVMIIGPRWSVSSAASGEAACAGTMLLVVAALIAVGWWLAVG